MSNVRDIEQIILLLTYLRSIMEPHIKLIYYLEKVLPKLETDYHKLDIFNPKNNTEAAWILVNELKASGEKANETMKEWENMLKKVLAVRTTSDNQKN